MTLPPPVQDQPTAHRAGVPPVVSAPDDVVSGAVIEPQPLRLFNPTCYVVLAAILVGSSLFAMWSANRIFAPEMYDSATAASIGETLGSGQNYAVFDLNVNIREIRNAQLARLPVKPDVILLGASHWQEAHVDLLAGRSFLNAHIHRDYYEDILGMVEMLVRHDKLPRHLMIAIRDNQFMPIAQRTDHLWLPGIPFYREMAKRLGLMPHAQFDTLPIARWRERLSLQMLYGNLSRWHKAGEYPHATRDEQFDRLDILLPGGSIVWSQGHLASYTAERSLQTTLAYVNARRNTPPTIDPIGVEAIDRLFDFLEGRGVHVVLVHPPFNPIAYDALKSERYMEGLRRVEALTRHFADRYGFDVIGSFDPYVLGCRADMYIDAEHANPTCLAKVFAQFSQLPRSRPDQAVTTSKPFAPVEATAARLDLLPLPPPPLHSEETATVVPAASGSGTAAPIVTETQSQTSLTAPAAEPPASRISGPPPTSPSLAPAPVPASQPRHAPKGSRQVRAPTAPRTARALSTAPVAVRR
jgi:hypothetical protein